MNPVRKIHFVASQIENADSAMEALQKQYGQHDLDEADVIVALGGDGFMLRTLHRFLPADLPVYGMKLGEVGFLMNRFRKNDLQKRLQEADVVELNPLCMIAMTEAGNETRALAINEVSLLRQLNQAAHIRILVNGSVKVEDLVCDGVLVSTAAGSSAYNFSAAGPILPLGTDFPRGMLCGGLP